MRNIEFETLFQQQFSSFWDDLNETDKNVLCSNTHTATYCKNEHIHTGSGCTGVIIVKTGCLRVYLMPEDGREITLYRLFPGDLCMLSASCVLQAITFDVTVSAEQESTCCVINGGVFAEISDRNLSMKNYALEQAVARFSDVMWVMQQILFMSFDKRLAIFLWDEMIKNNSPVIRMTREQIAKYTGSAREVVSRMLKYFASEGIIENSRSGITVLDKQRLRRLTL